MGDAARQLSSHPVYFTPLQWDKAENLNSKSKKKLALDFGGQDEDSLLHEEKTWTTKKKPPKTNKQNKTIKQKANVKVLEVKLSILLKISFFLSLDDSQLSILLNSFTFKA